MLTRLDARGLLFAVPRKREKSQPTGKFVTCSGSFIAHSGWVFTEVLKSQGGHYFSRCSCMGRGTTFLPWYEEGYGWDLWQVEAPPAGGGWGGSVQPEIPPPRRLKIEALYRDRAKTKAQSTLTARPAAPTRRS